MLQWFKDWDHNISSVGQNERCIRPPPWKSGIPRVILGCFHVSLSGHRTVAVPIGDWRADEFTGEVVALVSAITCEVKNLPPDDGMFLFNILILCPDWPCASSFRIGFAAERLRAEWCGGYRLW